MAATRLPPGPRIRDVLSSALGAARYLPGYFQGVARRYGDIACIAAGPVRVFLLSSPEYAQDLLVDHDHLFQKGRGERRFTHRLLGKGVLGSEGELHRRQHELLWPTLHGEAVARFVDAISAGAARLEQGWRDGDVVDAFDLLTRTVQDIMIEALFGVRIQEPEGRELALALAEAIDALQHQPPPLVPGIERLPLPANRRFDLARRRLDSMLLPLIAARRSAEPADGSLVSALVRAVGPEGEGMDDVQVRDEALSIFRGHRTVGTVVSWVWYLLSRHTGVEGKVHQEIDSVLRDRPPAASDVARLDVCRNVFDETVRLFPGAWMMARRAIAEHEISGFPIPVGSTVITSSYVIHRDPRFHPEPRRFDPERFAAERRAAWHPFAYFPFGGGPRMCLGDEFARFEAVLLMAAVGRRWRLRPAPGFRPEPGPRATFVPRGGMRLLLERRG
jgi:cytochrome P450